MITKHNPSAEVQAKYLVHKENFLQKFKSESNNARYSVFSFIFDANSYNEIQTRYQTIHQQFDNASGTLDCNVLLTTTFNFTPYTKNIEEKAQQLSIGLDKLSAAITGNKIDIKSLETPA